MIYVIVAATWFICGLFGAAGRSYAAAVTGVSTSFSSDLFAVATGPVGLVAGVTNYAAARGALARKEVMS